MAALSDRFAALHTQLLPFQRTGVAWAIERGGRCLIADEMGLGKTVQAIALIARYEADWPALVVCPSSMRGSWVDELERWLPTLPSARIRVVRGKADVESVHDPGVAVVVCTCALLLIICPGFPARNSGRLCAATALPAAALAD
ncbi:P-loop containing nucleoside triphosphate hydrolase protein [Pavlovales sp. CCMP2436]|nr:P-loop containing nucleoside triphosphate hydrolase protein [Pavlovales sp. CCMP2436]